MSLLSVTNRAGLAGLFLVSCLGGACKADKVDEAYSRGQEAFSLGDYPRAITHFNEAIEVDSNRAEGYLGRGMVYWRQVKHEQALPELSRAITLDAELIWAYYFRGASLISLRRYEEGVHDFTKVTAAATLPTEDLVRAHRWRGIALLNLERYEESIEDFTQCIDLQPDEPFHYVERGRIYEVLHQREEAGVDYKRYLALTQGEDAVTEEVKQRLGRLERSVSE